MAAHKTFKQLQDDALRWFDEVDDENELRENVKQAIVAAHLTRLSSRSWSFMKWTEPATFSTVAGQRSYILHQEFFRPVYFYNRDAQQWLRQVTDANFASVVTEGSLQGMTDGGTDWVTRTGAAYRFELRGVSPVQAQPTSASALTLSSSSASDSSAQQVKVRGETANGIEEETIACGSGGAAATGTTEFTKILRVTKTGDAWNGTLTLTSNGAAVTNLKLFSSEYARFYQQLYLLQTPTTAETVEYLFTRQPSPLVEDNDVPDIPPPYQDILVYDALIDLATYQPVETNALKIWTARLDKLEEGLLDTYGEAHSLEREAEYTGYIPRD